MEIGWLEGELNITKTKERSSCITESDSKGHGNAEDLSCDSGTIARCRVAEKL